MTKSCALKGRQRLFFLQLGTAASCCKAYSESLSVYSTVDKLTELWKQESTALDQGQEITSCTYCWQRESQGQQSYRQLKVTEVADQIELYLDNTCNQMCSYCSPKFSSTWENSIAEHGMFDNISEAAKYNLKINTTQTQHQYWIDQIHQHIQQLPDHSVTLKLLGGEPLMQIRHLQKLVELDNNKIRQLRITTNLNPPSNKFLVWILQHVPAKRLHFDISLDATPEFNHVPRAGFDRSKFVENLQLIQSHCVSYKFLSVVSVLSIFDLHNFLTWGQTNQHRIELLPLNNPECLDPMLLPQEFKSHVDPTGLPGFVQDILQSGTTVVDSKLKEQYNYLLEYFKRTHIDPTTVANELFVQYWDFLSRKFT